eukprot:1194160-Prorocentrum_minimum.AAC.2
MSGPQGGQDPCDYYHHCPQYDNPISSATLLSSHCLTCLYLTSFCTSDVDHEVDPGGRLISARWLNCGPVTPPWTAKYDPTEKQTPLRSFSYAAANNRYEEIYPSGVLSAPLPLLAQEDP